MHNAGWTKAKWQSNSHTYIQKMNWYTFTQIAYTGSSKFQMRCTPLVASCQQQQYYIRSSWHPAQCNWECIGYIVSWKFQMRCTPQLLFMSHDACTIKDQKQQQEYEIVTTMTTT